MKKILLIALVIFLSNNCFSQSNIGYLVAVTSNSKVKFVKTQNVNEIQKMMNLRGLDFIPVKKILENDEYFGIGTPYIYFYVEKKIVTKKKNGKLKYKKYNSNNIRKFINKNK